MKKRTFLMLMTGSIVATFICQAVFVSSAASASFPSKNIVWIVPFSPGGGFDTYSRAIARVMPKYLPNQVNVVIKNVTGAGGRRGSASLYRSKPDGYTIGILNIQGLVAADYFIKKAKEFELKKFVYLATIVTSHSGIFVPTNSPYKTLKDLQAAEKVRFAISGVGSSSWINAVFIKEILKVPVHIVSGYAGSSQFVVAAIKGEADAVSSGDVTTEMRYIRAGEVRPILVFTLTPSQFLPDVPHVGGTPYEVIARITPLDRVVVAPPGMPADLVKILEKALLNSLKDKEFVAWAHKAHRPLGPRGAAETRDAIMSLIDLYADYSKKIKK